MRCEHSQIKDFKVGKKWRCSACGVTDVWGPTWGYYGSIGCRHCHQEPVIELVACSEACMQKHTAGAKHERNEMKLARVREDIAVAEQRLEALRASEKRLTS